MAQTRPSPKFSLEVTLYGRAGHRAGHGPGTILANPGHSLYKELPKYLIPICNLIFLAKPESTSSSSRVG